MRAAMPAPFSAYIGWPGGALLSLSPERFLRLTGSDTAENLARRILDCDLETPQFWAGAIQTLETPLLELEKL